MQTAVIVLALLLVAGLVLSAVRWQRGRRGFTTVEERAAFEALHTASLAAPPLRMGLTGSSASRSAKHLRALLGAPALALTDTDRLLVWEGPGEHHDDQLAGVARRVVATGRPAMVTGAELACDDPSCPVEGAVVVPLRVGDVIAGALVAVSPGDPGPGLLQAALETARWISTQLELAELDRSRARLAQAEVRALRAQISPHFVYNALTAIASFVRTDPPRARELLLEFAEFTRYSFRAHGDFTTLAEELRNIDRYLTLERARFGDRLSVRLQIAPEVLPVALPFLTLQPLVENAVRHGLAGKMGTGTITILAQDSGAECHISVEDDGVGMDPDLLIAATADSESGVQSGAHVGLSNVDDRLRSVFGDSYGLEVETAPGAGTKVSMRIPKFSAGVRAS